MSSFFDMLSAFIAMLIAAVFLHFGGTEETNRHDAPPSDSAAPAAKPVYQPGRHHR